MDLLHDVEAVLVGSGYETRVASAPENSLYFEDESLFGYCLIHRSVAELIANWSSSQDIFLTTHAPSLRRADQKAWNCYSVHLTDVRATTEELRDLFAIEEDFRSTRKIARAGIASTADLTRALFPILPLQNTVRIRSTDSQKDLSARLHWPAAATRALLGTGSVHDILELLLSEDK